jgi:hypothetical protein
VSIVEKSPAEVEADEAGSAGNENPHLGGAGPRMRGAEAYSIGGQGATCCAYARHLAD